MGLISDSPGVCGTGRHVFLFALEENRQTQAKAEIHDVWSLTLLDWNDLEDLIKKADSRFDPRSTEPDRTSMSRTRRFASFNKLWALKYGKDAGLPGMSLTPV